MLNTFLNELPDSLWNGFVQNAATFLCAYATIIEGTLYKRRSREQCAKQSYLSLLGKFMEHNTIPDEKGLASLKEDFSKRFNVKASSFPIKKEALEGVSICYRTDTTISLARKAVLQEKLIMFCETFLMLDSRVEATPYYKSYRNTLCKDSIIQFGVILILLILSSSPDSFEAVFIVAFWAAFGAFWGIALYWLASWACHKAGLGIL